MADTLNQKLEIAKELRELAREYSGVGKGSPAGFEFSVLWGMATSLLSVEDMESIRRTMQTGIEVQALMAAEKI